MIKTRKVIDRMRQLEAGVRVLKNILSEQEVYYLRNLHATLKQDPALHRPRSIIDNRRNELTIVREEHFDAINNIIEPKMGLQPFKYDSMNFYTIQNPYHLHSDTGKNNRISYVQGVIPLEIAPSNVETRTLIFDQKVYYSSEYVFPNTGKDPGYEPFNNVANWEPIHYENWTDEDKISEEQAKRYWYDKWKFWKSQYHGFSVKHEYVWSVGDILLFDRSNLHAATLLKEADIDYKVGLLFLTYVDE